MSKKVEKKVSWVSTNNDSEASSEERKTIFFGSFMYKDSFGKSWGGWEEFSLTKMAIYSFL